MLKYCYMVFCDNGIVLWRRPLRENDRIVTIFTRERGKFEVNFKSVRLPGGKLRSLSEPVSHGDYRFFLKNGSNFPVCTGGSSISVFPRIRLETERLFAALNFCEVINKITPAHQPSPEKYDLLLGALENLEDGLACAVSPWMRRAFTLRALETAGFGFQHTSVGLDSRLWETLHSGAWSEVHALPADPQAMDYLDNLLRKFFSEQLNRQLKTLEFV